MAPIFALTRAIVLSLCIFPFVLAQDRCAPLPAHLPAPSDLPIIPLLPNPFEFRLSHQKVNSLEDWSCRKAEIKTLVQEYLYGYYPDHSLEKVTATRSGNTLNITIAVNGNITSFPATLTFPNTTTSGNTDAKKERIPVVINTGGIDNDPFLASGVALATFNVGDVAVDGLGRTGAFWDLYFDRDIGTLTAWAWGFHRIIDAMEQVVPEIDPTRIGAVGCSRDGKASLAAGIFDERVALTLSMSSGAEGIGPWRFYYESQGAAEKINNIYGGFPYWSNSVLGQFVNLTGNSTHLPFDAHEMVSLVAPRAIIWDEGDVDWWTNPEGVTGVTFEASKIIYEWLGAGDQIAVSVRQAPDNGHCGETGYTLVQPFLQKTFFGTKSAVNFSDISPFPAHPEAYPWSTAVPRQF
ncbi:carbohydrate esterase family 15 protein [Ramaria rubella]|nr:carbohydrate esterase family 15 protein [Ramaria rubella]